MSNKIEALTLMVVLIVASVAVFVGLSDSQPTGAMVVPQKYCKNQFWQYPHRINQYEGCVPLYNRPTQQTFNPYDDQVEFYTGE